MKRLDSLQAVRAIAALLVVFFHVESVFLIKAHVTPFGGNFINGKYGVDLFFVLSGFIMVYIHRIDIGNSRRFFNFLYTRAARIFPLMWIISVLAILLYAAGLEPAKTASKLGFWPLVDSIFLLPQQADPLVNVTWTLKYEIFFYLVFSALFLNRFIGLLLILAWQFSILALYIFHIDTAPLWGFYLRPIALEFGIGTAVGWLITSAIKTNHPVHGVVAALTLACGTIMFLVFMVHPVALPSCLTFGIAAGLIIFASASLELIYPLKIPAFVVLLGDASYAIYLIHYSVVTICTTILLREKLPGLNSYGAACLAVIGITAGLIFYKIIDQPITKILQTLKRRLFGSRPAKPAYSV